MKEKIDVQKPDDLGLDISDLRYFLVMLLFSAVVFFLLISQRLTNTFDGLWNNTWFFGGYWQGPMALAGDRCAAVWHPDGTFQFIADAFHVGAGGYPASEVFYREGFCRDLSGGYGCSGQHGH